MIGNILLAILIVYSFIVLFDWLVYIVKSAPKASTFLILYWKIAFVTTSLLVYYIINGMKWM